MQPTKVLVIVLHSKTTPSFDGNQQKAVETARSEEINARKIFYADTLKVSSGALIEVTLLFRYSTTDREATRVLALFGHLSEWQFN